MSDTPRTDATVTGNSDPTVDEYEDLAFFARQLEREIARLRKDAATLCEIIDHANPGAWSNGNTHPDLHGPDEGEVMMSNLYSPLRAEYASAAHNIPCQEKTSK